MGLYQTEGREKKSAKQTVSEWSIFKDTLNFALRWAEEPTSTTTTMGTRCARAVATVAVLAAALVECSVEGAQTKGRSTSFPYFSAPIENILTGQFRVIISG